MSASSCWREGQDWPKCWWPEKRNISAACWAKFDQALQRIEEGTFGICEECHTEIGEDWLRENPLTTVCIEHMTPKQRSALEYDLEVAAQLQKGLLPSAELAFEGWQIAHHYQAAGVVSGDYCDVIRENGHLYFIMADVCGKRGCRGDAGVESAGGIPVADSARPGSGRLCVARQSAVPRKRAAIAICEPRFLRCTSNSGELELVNVGHLPAILAGGTGIRRFDSTCRPLGIFADDTVCVARGRMAPGDTLVLYTDGISEAANESDEEYGIEAVVRLIDEHRSGCPDQLIAAVKKNLLAFRGRAERADDETLLAIQYAPAGSAMS